MKNNTEYYYSQSREDYHYYFSGDLRDLASPDPDGSLLAGWQSRDIFTWYYLSTVLQEAGADHTHWYSGE